MRRLTYVKLFFCHRILFVYGCMRVCMPSSTLHGLNQEKHKKKGYKWLMEAQDWPPKPLTVCLMGAIHKQDSLYRS